MIMYFLCKHKDLSLDSQKPSRKADEVIPTYNPRTGEAETGGASRPELVLPSQ